MKAVRFFFGSEAEAYRWAQDANWWRPTHVGLYRYGTMVMLVGSNLRVAYTAQKASQSSSIHPLSSTVPALLPPVSYRIPEATAEVLIGA